MQLSVLLLSLVTLGTCQTSTYQTSLPQPTPVDGNIKGSSMCRTITPSHCQEAIGAFENDKLYTNESFYTSAQMHWMPIFPWTYTSGCQAKFWCDNEDYSVTGDGVFGTTLKDAVKWLEETQDMTRCGTVDLSNGCHVTVNYCTSGGCNNVIKLHDAI